MSSRTLLLSAGLLGFAGVVLGALGAHGLHHTLMVRQTAEVWRTAVLYHLAHTVALLALGGGSAAGGGRLPRLAAAAAACWIGGVICFSGSLYALALGGPRALGPVTPLGGLLFLAGWSLVFVMGWRTAAGKPSP
jgi:uncharacterized membrane protein YgdD (TMEM256/DUF423 family)